MSLLPPPSSPAVTPPSYTCPYCRMPGDASGTSCPHCGAPVDIRAKVSQSGWERQPPIRDMARIQFGHSTCQVSGTYVPVAELRLHEGETVYFSHHVLLWADTAVRLGQQPLKGAWNRTMAGLPLVMMEATGPGTLALSDDHAGETVAVPLVPGRVIDVREHRFLAATSNVTYAWNSSNLWYRTGSGDDTETHYPVGMFVDRFTAEGTPGLLLLHSPGNLFVRDLAPGQTICIHPGAFVWKDATAGMALHLERARGTSWSSRWRPTTPWLRVWGPGRVAVSSVFERLEGTGNITGTSPATGVDWNNTAQAVAVTATAAVDHPRVRASLDQLAAQHGFALVDESSSASLSSHTYRHPGGIDVVVEVGSGSAGLTTAMNQLFGGQSSALAVGAANLLGSLSRAASKAGGQRFEGLGDEAFWRGGTPTSDMIALRGGQQVHVRITSSIPTEQQFGWARAFAAAALAS